MSLSPCWLIPMSGRCFRHSHFPSSRRFSCCYSYSYRLYNIHINLMSYQQCGDLVCVVSSALIMCSLLIFFVCSKGVQPFKGWLYLVLTTIVLRAASPCCAIFMTIQIIITKLWVLYLSHKGSVDYEDHVSAVERNSQKVQTNISTDQGIYSYQ